MALIETVRVEAGTPQLWDEHVERLVLSAAELGFPVPPSAATLADAVQELLAAAALDDAAIRITVTRGVLGMRPGRPGCWIDAEPLSARLWRGTRSGRGSAVVWSVPFSPGPFGRHKTANRLAYQQAADQARVAHADEALLVSPSGELLEAANSNVFVVQGDAISTPPLSTGILPGVTRRALLEGAQRAGLSIRERAVPVAELETASEVFVTNAIQQLCNLRQIDGHELPGGDAFERSHAAFMRHLTHRSG
jgi:branched-subunit amino acid aminotransferase/4-amino-4-deoxychorismate lyase